VPGLSSDRVRGFYQHVRRVVIDALGIVRSWKANGKFFLERPSFPSISYTENGLPRYWEWTSLSRKTPIDYTYPFRAFSGEREAWPASWTDLWSFVESDPRLREFFNVDLFRSSSSSGESYGELMLRMRMQDLLDHYVHSTGLLNFRKAQFLPLFLKWARSIYPEVLPVEFVVPVIFADFEIDDYSLPAGMAIRRMSRSTQLARSPGESTGVAVNREVLGAATHALVLTSWELPNKSLWDRDKIPTDVGAMEAVIPHVDRFFAAVRAVTGFDTGYGQILTRGMDWADRWSAHLEDLFVLQVREYPERIATGWRRAARPKVSEAQMGFVSEILSGLEEGGTQRLAIAARRLNSAYLRREEADSVIDICIGLETLLVGDDRGEITHKLAMRLAAVWQITPALEYSPHEVFVAAKKLYAYRSAVVHGSRKADRRRVIRPRPDVEVPAVQLGLDLLRHCLLVAARQPEVLDEGVLDQRVLRFPQN